MKVFDLIFLSIEIMHWNAYGYANAIETQSFGSGLSHGISMWQHFIGVSFAVSLMCVVGWIRLLVTRECRPLSMRRCVSSAYCRLFFISRVAELEQWMFLTSRSVRFEWLDGCSSSSKTVFPNQDIGHHPISICRGYFFEIIYSETFISRCGKKSFFCMAGNKLFCDKSLFGRKLYFMYICVGTKKYS